MATRYAELVRYGIVAHDDGSDRMEPVARGQWVRADEAAAAITALEADVERLEAALKPFSGDKMPAKRRTLIDYDRYGLRRIISPMEIAMLRASEALASIESKP